MLEEYSKKIEDLKSFEKEDILTEKFQLYKEGNMAIYYAPHNETINQEAKIFIVGITPGWTQTQIAYKTANEELKRKKDLIEIRKACKRNSRFAGSMRKNLIEMLNELKLNEKLKMKSCEELFEEKENLLHTTSLIPYPVFIKEKNYTGHSPKILEDEVLSSYVSNYFYKEARSLPKALIIPLGKSVEEVLQNMVEKNLLKEEQILFGFPHPSGANGHRKMQLEENKEILKKRIKDYFLENDLV